MRKLTTNSAQVLSMLYTDYNKHNLPFATFLVYSGFDDETARGLEGPLFWKLDVDLLANPKQAEERYVIAGLDADDEIPELPGAYLMGDAIVYLLGDGRWLYAEIGFDGP